MIDLTKEEAAALLCAMRIRYIGCKCENCYIREKVADYADCHDLGESAKEKLGAYVEAK